MLDNSTVVEILWSLASGIASLIHIGLTLAAFLDWQATWTDRPTRRRGKSARWYFVGQGCLFLPALIELAIGVYFMTIPNPRNEVIVDAAVIAQSGLIVGKWIGVVGAVAFWLARRALAT